MRRGTLVMLVCMVACQVIAQTANAGSAVEKILALERIGKFQASQLKDLKMLGEILDESFVSVDYDGTLMNKTQVLAYVESATSLRFVSSEMNIRLHGECAIVTGVYELKSLVGGKIIVRRGRFIDTWLQKDGRWVAIASLTTALN